MTDTSDSEMFTLVVKKRKITNSTTINTQNTKKSKTTSQPIVTQNRYENLTDESDDSDSDSEPTTFTAANTQPATSSKATQNKKTKITPLVLHGGISSAKKLRQYIEKHAKTNEYELQHGFNKTLIYFHDDKPRKILAELLLKNKMDFHTYTNEADRNHSFVLCGLEPDTDLEELKEELGTIRQLHLRNIFKMNNTRITKFLIITDNTVTMKTLEGIKIVSRTRITWQRYYNNKIFIQCHRCQQWGHATSNCYATPNCLKCAEQHFTRDCKMKDDEPTKCINCDGNHPANSTECRVYQQLLANYNKKKNSTSPSTENKTPTQAVPNIKSKTEFQPLRPPRTPLSQAWKPVNPESEPSTNEQDGFKDMMSELKKLNQLINIKLFTERLRILNSTLSNCTKESDKFNAMQKFYFDLDNGE